MSWRILCTFSERYVVFQLGAIAQFRYLAQGGNYSVKSTVTLCDKAVTMGQHDLLGKSLVIIIIIFIEIVMQVV